MDDSCVPDLLLLSDIDRTDCKFGPEVLCVHFFAY